MTIRTDNDDRPTKRRSGFTLTEMLVAVGLLLIIMTIFAQIFQLAVTAMTRQKGLANNDSQARTAFSVLDADLKRMSFRSIRDGGGIVPLVPGLRYDGDTAAAPEQRGYFYFSENNPNNDTDDVLQFTVDASLTGQYSGARRYAGQSETPYYGKGTSLSINNSRRDQPDWDDGTPGDNVSVSRWAEVAYFLRHGTLYRRVVLVRDTDDGSPRNMQEFDDGNIAKLAQPGYPSGGEPIDMMIGYKSSGNEFYQEFDFSAHYDDTPYNDDLLSPLSTPPKVAVFHGSLSNEITGNWPLGIPHFRFGFNHETGRPREFFSNGSNDYFLGRYTQEETSHPDFDYPARVPTSDPFTRNDFDVSTYVNSGRADVYSGHSTNNRRGADILLMNVHSFDVEIWDPTAQDDAGAFVDINSSASDSFAISQRKNANFGPSSVMSENQRLVFDTWHSYSVTESPTPWPSTSTIAATGNELPPFVPVYYYPVGATLPLGVANNSSAPGMKYYNFVNKARWNSGLSISDGLIIFPTTGTSLPYRDTVYWVAELQHGLTAPQSYPSTPVEPSWGNVVVPGETSINDPNDLDGIPANNPDVIWHAVDNRKPVKAIRLTVRFLDPNSGQMRQVTMIHSFNENDIDAEFN